MVDLDGDGDLDAVVGNGVGYLRTFENTGSSSNPAFVERIGPANPFDDVLITRDCSPELVDFDGDGDFDTVIGEGYGRVFFLRSLNRILGDDFESDDTSAWSNAIP